MNKIIRAFSLIESHSFYGCSRHNSKILRSLLRFSSSNEVVVPPKSRSVAADVEIVNYNLAGLYITGYNQYSFLLSNGTTMYGPVAAFPQNAFSWNVCAVFSHHSLVDHVCC